MDSGTPQRQLKRLSLAAASPSAAHDQRQTAISNSPSLAHSKSLRRQSMSVSNGLDTIDETGAAHATRPSSTSRTSLDSLRAVTASTAATSNDPLAQYSPQKSISRGRTRPSNAGGHVRGLSSISYSSSSSSIRDLASPVSQQSTSAVLIHGTTGRPRSRHETGDSGELSSMAASPIAQRSSLELRMVNKSDVIGTQSLDSALANHEIDPASVHQDLFSVASATNPASDLLSFIAKKEQRCLELREELRKHEDDLQKLKRKWESIVSRNIHRPPAQVHDQSGQAKEGSSGGKVLSITQPSPDDDADVAVDLTDSVQAAKSWVGGVFGKVLNDSPWIRRSLSDTGEAEDANDVVPNAEHTSCAASDGADLRTAPAPAPVTPSRQPLQENQQRDALSPLAALKRSGSMHGRSRSTFDVISNVAGGSWSTLGKKLSAVADTVEQGLANALGPIEPESEVSSSKLGPVNKMRPVRSRSPSQMSDSDSAPSHGHGWTYQDESDQNGQKLGGYRRPSLTPKKQARSRATATDQQSRGVLEQVEETSPIGVDDVSKSWAAW
ncbi:hypothetical protein ACM66B_004315 [Microbotryomycetes sp. NB124-2]